MNTGQYITDGNVTWIVTDIRDGNTVGDIAYKPYLADGYVKANGATVLRADYPRLVALADQYSLWTSSPSDYPGLFGEGDGSTTMVLPDLRDRVLWGSASGAGTGVEAGLPNITGEHISSVPMGLWHGADGTLHHFQQVRAILTQLSTEVLALMLANPIQSTEILVLCNHQLSK